MRGKRCRPVSRGKVPFAGDDRPARQLPLVKQAKSLKDLVLPTALPGISINTSATSNMVWTQLQLQRWSGTNWELFGEVLDVRSE